MGLKNLHGQSKKPRSGSYRLKHAFADSSLSPDSDVSLKQSKVIITHFGLLFHVLSLKV